MKVNGRANGIYSYCALSKSHNVTCKSIEYDTMCEKDLNCSLLDIVPQYTTAILFISLDVDTVSERRQSLSALIQKRYGVLGDLISERQYEAFSKSIRVGVFQINNQEINVLKLLYAMSNRSFVVLSKEKEYNRRFDEFVECVLDVLRQGILLPSILDQCCNEAIKRNFAFLHILRGFDGYSINCFVPN